ncbi:MAG: AAA family ATPase [Planctomycetaceae bacterium]|jgi:DNA polymerase III gamma/tau subunit|nr:AAA family ATPase [Planctomycetaceae bacterium]
MQTDQQPTELYRKYRPKGFKGVVGQDTVIQVIQGWVEKHKVPHAVLMSGPSGTGKTTVARILAKKLNCLPPRDLIEINAADFNGIDTVRDIRKSVGSYSLMGKEYGRCWIIDECFHADTLVKTVDGNKRIADVQVGDHAYSAIGEDTVVRKYVKHVSLDRVCRVVYEDKVTFVSKDHLYFTARGWVKAIDLNQDDIIYRLNDKYKELPTGFYCLWHKLFGGTSTLDMLFNKEQQQCQRNNKHIHYLLREYVSLIKIESVTIYESGNNDQSDWSIITDQDRSRGYVEFYDLEMEKHHSYFANDVLVHNCHQLSTAAQQGLLKLLEEAPFYAYFFLCTTDPQKIIPTIKTRCSEIKLNPVAPGHLVSLCQSVLAKEEIEINDNVLEQLALVSDGSPRKCLVKLEQLIELPDDKTRLKSLSKDETFTAAIKDLGEIFTKTQNRSWKEVAKIVKSLCEENEPESIRYAILGWLNSALLNGWARGVSDAALAEIIQQWVYHFYESKSAGVTLAAYRSWAIK